MPNVKDQPRVKNVHLVKDAPKSRAGVTGYNMHYALPLGIVLLIGLYAIAKAFF